MSKFIDFFSKNKTVALIGGAILAAGGVLLFLNKDKLKSYRGEKNDES
jgi:hypothetical protein